MTKLGLVICFGVLLFSCSEKDKNTYKPKSSGKPGAMVVIMDSTQWNGPLGEEVRRVFSAEILGLPQPEPMFDVQWVQPGRLNLIRQVRNLVYVATLDNKTVGGKILKKEFDAKTINKINTDTSFYFSGFNDMYSKGQTVMFLFGRNQPELISKLKRNRTKIQHYFLDSENKRLKKNLLSVKSTHSITNYLKEKEKCAIHIPVGYKIADQQRDFIWLRYMDAVIDKDIIIGWKPYTSEKQLSRDSLIAWRNELGQKYLYEDPEMPNSYIETELENDFVYSRSTTINGNFAQEIRGLWITHTRSMGGPFVGYGIADPAQGKVYYIEGFSFAPGKDKREFMRELEVILGTFEISTNLSK